MNKNGVNIISLQDPSDNVKEIVSPMSERTITFEFL